MDQQALWVVIGISPDITSVKESPYKKNLEHHSNSVETFQLSLHILASWFCLNLYSKKEYVFRNKKKKSIGKIFLLKGLRLEAKINLMIEKENKIDLIRKWMIIYE